MGGLPLPEVEDQRRRLWGLFDQAGPFLDRDLRVFSRGLRLGSTSASLPFGGAGIGPAGPVPPTSSYQWLFFEEIDGGVPGGAAEFVFDGPPIPFVGAITEVDVVASEPNNEWTMQIGVNSLGSIFQTTQPDVILSEQGFFRPTPPGFWPETEGLVFALPSTGLMPQLKFKRETDKAKNLIVRVLMVAHPSG